MPLPRVVASNPGHMPCSSWEAQAPGQGESGTMGECQRKRGDERGGGGMPSHLAYWVSTPSPSAAPSLSVPEMEQNPGSGARLLGLNPDSATSCVILENRLTSMTLGFPIYKMGINHRPYFSWRL